MKIKAFLLAVLLLPFSIASAVEWSGVDVKGQAQSLEKYRGKWIVVNFWATWCPPCLAELPELTMFHDQHAGKDAVVIGLNMEDISKEKMLEFLDEQDVDYPVVIMGERGRTEFGRISGLPTSFLVSPAGEVVAKQVGPVSGDMLETFMKRWQAANP